MQTVRGGWRGEGGVVEELHVNWVVEMGTETGGGLVGHSEGRDQESPYEVPRRLVSQSEHQEH